MIEVLIILSRDSRPELKICGVPVIVRIVRALYNAGLRDIIISDGEHLEKIKRIFSNGEKLGLNIRYDLDDIRGDAVIILSSKILIDEKLVEELIKQQPNTLFTIKDNDKEIPVAALIKSEEVSKFIPLFEEQDTMNFRKIAEEYGLNVICIDQIKVYYDYLRRHLELLAIPVRNEKECKEAARVLVSRTQKGLHIFASVNRFFENALVRIFCNHTWITPNRVTILSNITAYLTALLFILQRPYLAIIMGFITAILDGTDGKLARVRGILTKLGKIEHSFDMLFEQIIYVSWIYYVYTVTNSLLTLILGLVFLVSDSFTRHIYMQFRISTGKNLLLMSRIDRIIAKIDGRRNMWFLYMLIGIITYPFYGLILMLIHSIATSTVYAIRAIYHLRRIDIEQGTKSWMDIIYKS